MKLKSFQFSHLRSVAARIFSLWAALTSAASCGQTIMIQDATGDDIRRFFEQENKVVVTFVGYSGAEYEDTATMLEEAGRLLEEFDSSTTIVNIGATSAGIGAVYELAKDKGFITTGIISTQAREDAVELSPWVDYVFYVEDATWGGFIEEGARLSPTSAATVENSDVVIGIGGGDIARDELMAAKRLGKEVRFIPAEMNHHKAREKARKKGLPVPMNFDGAAGEAF